ncbi:hypothetical protein [uncultured Ruminococcus sp.]|uniref:hypothetical protein n=1 Tax=uncultured Ruminococcus sp. TaxID=165186 RepID=UPI002627AB6E|nr:hypothetical protein [uncultured Ruminococcus sp.]
MADKKAFFTPAVAIFAKMWYNKCVLNNRLTAVIAPDFVRGARILLHIKEFAQHISLCNAHFALKGKTKCKKKRKYLLFFLAL